jgi:hypothetical protein
MRQVDTCTRSAVVFAPPPPPQPLADGRRGNPPVPSRRAGEGRNRHGTGGIACLQSVSCVPYSHKRRLNSPVILVVTPGTGLACQHVRASQVKCTVCDLQYYCSASMLAYGHVHMQGTAHDQGGYKSTLACVYPSAQLACHQLEALYGSSW